MLNDLIKRFVAIVALLIVGFFIGWWCYSMNEFAEGVNQDYKNGNYALISVRHHETTIPMHDFSDTSKNKILVDTLIKDQQTARIIAEAILFKIYGEEPIKKQRP